MVDGRCFSVCVVGGGLVGISFALALRRALPAERLRVTLLEAWPLQAKSGEMPRAVTDLDARSTALSWGTREIFRRSGHWDALQEGACPIGSIHVSEQGRMGVTRISARECSVPALGYVVENAFFGNRLLQALQAEPDLQVLAPVEVCGIAPQRAGTLVTGQDKNNGASFECAADLVVLCDGGRSGLTQQLGLASRAQDYAQQAVVFNVRTERAHEGMAYERFTPDGPMALLPLGGDRRAVICTLSTAAARAMLAGDADAVAARLESQFGRRIGAVTEVGTLAGHPLALRTVSEQVRPGLAVLGNAAHTLHPVAGQGFNLSMRDAESLVRVVVDQAQSGRSPGELVALSAWERARSGDQGGVIGFTHALNRVFGAQLAAIGPLRSSALVSLDLLAPARRRFAEHAMGVA